MSNPPVEAAAPLVVAQSFSATEVCLVPSWAKAKEVAQAVASMNGKLNDGWMLVAYWTMGQYTYYYIGKPA